MPLNGPGLPKPQFMPLSASDVGAFDTAAADREDVGAAAHILPFQDAPGKLHSNQLKRNHSAASHPQLAGYIHGAGRSPDAGKRQNMRMAGDDLLAGVGLRLQDMAALSAPRKQVLARDLDNLRQSLANLPSRPTQIYLMEGATGLASSKGLPSTDPDENMALKTIAVLARCRNEAAVIALPDQGNVAWTLKFLQRQGARAEILEAGKKQQPGVIYLTRMDDEASITETCRQTGAGRELVVLGPPLGHAEMLLDDVTRVTIMGSLKPSLVNQGGIEELSTNTKKTASQGFLRKALERDLLTIPSDDMGPKSALSLSELAAGTNLITDQDKDHWAKNSWHQFLGVAPHSLTEKRLKQGGALALFDQKITLEDAPGLMFRPLLEQMIALEPQTGQLGHAYEILGKGYGHEENRIPNATPKDRLREIVSAHRKFEEFTTPYEADREACFNIIDAMSEEHAACAFAAIALAFKSIYDEKTAGGWDGSDVPGQQFRAAAFVDSYNQKPGNQVAYDAMTVLEPFIGRADTDEQKASNANKTMLMLWADLAAPAGWS